MTIKRINVFMLAMLITGAIDSIRNLPTTALFGAELIFFCIFAAVVFLIPTALVAADLSSRLPEHGGVYRWVRLAFGENMGFLTVWLQWINTIVWYPTILSFIAGTLAYLIDPALLDDKVYLVSVILITFWALTLLNLRGLHVSAKFASICTVIGMVIPMAVIIILGVIWSVSGHAVHVHFTFKAMMPNLNQPHNWISLTAIMASFLGMELAAVHVQQVENPRRNFPRALMVSVVIILSTMILGALSIAEVLPGQRISLVSGVVQAMRGFLNAYHLSWCLPIFVLLILIGSVGSMINWIISPAKGLLQAGQHGFLPAWMAKENENGVAKNLLLLQAVLVSVVCLAFLWMPSVNGSYWFLTDLSTELYLLMYVVMFFSAIRLYKLFNDRPAPFHLPGGKAAIWVVAGLGLFGSILAMVVGFIPPSNINVGNPANYEWLFFVGMLVMVLPVLFFVAYRQSQLKRLRGDKLS